MKRKPLEGKLEQSISIVLDSGFPVPKQIAELRHVGGWSEVKNSVNKEVYEAFHYMLKKMNETWRVHLSSGLIFKMGTLADEILCMVPYY